MGEAKQTIVSGANSLAVAAAGPLSAPVGWLFANASKVRSLAALRVAVP
jgi:hypothetical protein